MRLYGVLPRIALCYLLAGLILIATSKLKSRVPVLIGIIATLLIGYWALLRFVPVPGAGLPVRDIPFMDQTQNLTSWLDRAAMAFTQRWLHTGRLYLAARDPEGLLSTLPAVATTLLGALTGLWMRQTHGPYKSPALRRMQLTLAAAGILGVLAGELWSPYFPINKNLWTSSYVLLSAGWAALAARPPLAPRRPPPRTLAPLAPHLHLALVRLRLQRHRRLHRLGHPRQDLPLHQAHRRRQPQAQPLGPLLQPRLRPPRLHQLDLARLRHQHRPALLYPQLAAMAPQNLPQDLSAPTSSRAEILAPYHNRRGS